MKHLDKVLDHMRADRDLLDRAIEQLAAYQASTKIDLLDRAIEQLAAYQASTKIDLASQQEASDLVALASRKPS